MLSALSAVLIIATGASAQSADETAALESAPNAVVRSELEPEPKPWSLSLHPEMSWSDNELWFGPSVILCHRLGVGCLGALGRLSLGSKVAGSVVAELMAHASLVLDTGPVLFRPSLGVGVHTQQIGTREDVPEGRPALGCVTSGCGPYTGLAGEAALVASLPLGGDWAVDLGLSGGVAFVGYSDLLYLDLSTIRRSPEHAFVRTSLGLSHAF